MRHSTSTIFASALVGLALAGPVFAQGPGGPGGGGPGGGFRRPPGAYGTVSATDTTANTITITTRNGDSQVVKLGDGATITTETTILVSDLKVGDTVAVQGVPTGITASTLTSGTPPAGLPGAGGFGGGFGGPGGPGGGADPNAPQGMAMANGTILTLPTAKDAHLSISLGSDAVLYVKMADNAKINRYTTETLADIKTGDRIMAMGTQGDDGTLTATSVGVNLPQPNFGRGFGGGRRGGFGGGGGGGFGGGGGNGAPPPPGQ